MFLFLLPKMHRGFFFLVIIITTLVLIHIPATFSQNLYTTCGEPLQCGNVQMVYPFWGGTGRISRCGYPGFEINCENNVPLFRIDPLTYRVLAVNYTTQTLTLVRDDLSRDICPGLLYDTNLNFTILTYTSDSRPINLFYGCSPLIPSLPDQPNEFSCNMNDTTSISFFSTTSDSLGYNTSQYACNSSILVAVLQTAIPNIVSAETLRGALAGGFGVRWEANNDACNQCIESGGRCGYDYTSDPFVCYCSESLSTNLRCNLNGSQGRLPHRSRLILGISFGSAGLIFIIVAACYLIRRYLRLSNEEDDQIIEAFMMNHGSFAPKRYRYSEIKQITNSFSAKIGQGGYGSVYKGELPDGRLVAVKVLSESNGNGEDFINEVDSISRTSHVNVVNLLGFCYQRNNRALIYEFMPNGSLDKFIYNKSDTNDKSLEWRALYQIAVGIARGLAYLHQGCNTSIVHFDIKPQNILLDVDFCPKISDFGLAKLCKRKQSIVSSMLVARGTIGYIAPEVVFSGYGGASHKSDVYSYGIMILEMAGLKRSSSNAEEAQSCEPRFPSWIYQHLKLGGKGLQLHGIRNLGEEQIARKMILVAFWCIQTIPSNRPTMDKVVEMLQGDIELLQIPPKPSLYDPPMAQKYGTSSLSVTSSSSILTEITTSMPS